MAIILGIFEQKILKNYLIFYLSSTIALNYEGDN